MKRILFAFSLLLSLCLTTDAQAQNIHTTWRQKTIAVENGGESPTVIQLLKAFAGPEHPHHLATEDDCRREWRRVAHRYPAPEGI